MRQSSFYLAVIGLSALLLPTNTAAMSCFNIEEDQERLACYDRFFGFMAERETPSPTASAWTVRTDVSELDDSRNVYASVDSNESISCSWNRDRHKVRLFLRCQENTTAVILDTDCHMSSHNSTYGTVDYRADKDAPRQLEMVESTNNRSLGLWRGTTAIPFIKNNILNRERLLFRATPFSDNPFTVTFDVRGAADALKPLRQACNW